MFTTSTVPRVCKQSRAHDGNDDERALRVAEARAVAELAPLTAAPADDDDEV